MKKLDVEKALRKYGWWPCGGSDHDHWTNGIQKTTVPRHREINEYTAKAIIKLAKANPGKGAKKK